MVEPTPVLNGEMHDPDEIPDDFKPIWEMDHNELVQWTVQCMEDDLPMGHISNMLQTVHDLDMVTDIMIHARQEAQS